LKKDLFDDGLAVLPMLKLVEKEFSTLPSLLKGLQV
jgi:hypothetical protein